MKFCIDTYFRKRATHTNKSNQHQYCFNIWDNMFMMIGQFVLDAFVAQCQLFKHPRPCLLQATDRCIRCWTKSAWSNPVRQQDSNPVRRDWDERGTKINPIPSSAESFWGPLPFIFSKNNSNGDLVHCMFDSFPRDCRQLSLTLSKVSSFINNDILPITEALRNVCLYIAFWFQ